MDPPSDRSIDIEVYSSPIPNHSQQASGHELRTSDFPVETKTRPKKASAQKKKKKSRKDSVEDVAEISFWSPAKRNAWESRKTNPNAFYYRHVEPGQVKRTGLWDQSEKEAFMKAIKLHPPTQGKWGLFAMNIPGRVGYQCRNFYHRLLELGELHEDTVPGEAPVRKGRGPSKKNVMKPGKIAKRSGRRDESDDDDDDGEDENEVESVVEQRTIVSRVEEVEDENDGDDDDQEFQISSLRFFSTRVLKEEERIRREAELAQSKVGVVEDPDASATEVVMATVETLVRIVGTDDPIIADEYRGRVEADHDIIANEEDSSAAYIDPKNDDENIIIDVDIGGADEHQVADNGIISETVESVENVENIDTVEYVEKIPEWSPRMKQPWVTAQPCDGNIVFPLERPSDLARYEFQCSKILRCNSSCQLNLILLAFPAPRDLKAKYIKAVRERLAANESNNLFSTTLKRYFWVKDELSKNTECREEICRNFVMDFIKDLI